MWSKNIIQTYAVAVTFLVESRSPGNIPVPGEYFKQVAYINSYIGGYLFHFLPAFAGSFWPWAWIYLFRNMLPELRKKTETGIKQLTCTG